MFKIRSNSCLKFSIKDIGFFWNWFNYIKGNVNYFITYIMYDTIIIIWIKLIKSVLNYNIYRLILMLRIIWLLISQWISEKSLGS